MKPEQSSTQPDKPDATTATDAERAPYAKPEIRRLGLLRQLTHFSF